MRELVIGLDWIEVDKTDPDFYDFLNRPSVLMLNSGDVLIVGDLNLDTGVCDCCRFDDGLEQEDQLINSGFRYAYLTKE